MKPGPKKQPRSQKEAKGTAQPCRDGPRGRGSVVEAIVADANDLRLRPPELTPDIADVWAEYLPHAVANGVKQCDVEAFAEWCTMAAMLRKARLAETAAPASYVAQFRMLGELLGLAGPGSRMVAAGVEAAKTNPFARNGRR